VCAGKPHANTYGDRNGNGDCIGNAYGDRNSYSGAEAYADAKAASDTSASAVRSALAHVSSGTRDRLASPRNAHLSFYTRCRHSSTIWVAYARVAACSNQQTIIHRTDESQGRGGAVGRDLGFGTSLAIVDRALRRSRHQQFQRRHTLPN
jgi:hypothetical protein